MKIKCLSLPSIIPAIGCLLLGGFSLPAAVPSNKPNIVLILADDLGWRDLGCYGSTFYETPNLDRLARQGMRFTDAYSACPVCSPTRAALLTGKSPARLHFTGHITATGKHRHPKDSLIIPPEERMHVPLEEITLAEALKPAGYVSASIGKWHVGEKGFWPQDQGFDLNVAGWTQGSPPTYFWPYTNPKSESNAAIPGLEEGKPGEYLTDRLTDEAIRFIETNHQRNFLLYLPHYAVHTPLQAPPPLVGKYESKLKTDASQFDATYGAMVENLDLNVGRVMATLDRLGLSENTLLIFNSDNGGESRSTRNAPLRAGKGYLYEGGIRVPLIVRWSQHVKAGSVCNTPVTSEDLFATIVAAAGTDARPGQSLDGVSLMPLLTGKGAITRTALHWYYPHYPPQGASPGAALRDGKFKLVETYDPPRVELFNLATDPGETIDLAAKLPEKKSELLEKLHTWLHAVDAKMHTANPEAKTGPKHK